MLIIEDSMKDLMNQSQPNAVETHPISVSFFDASKDNISAKNKFGTILSPARNNKNTTNDNIANERIGQVSKLGKQLPTNNGRQKIVAEEQTSVVEAYPKPNKVFFTAQCF